MSSSIQVKVVSDRPVDNSTPAPVNAVAACITAAATLFVQNRGTAIPGSRGLEFCAVDGRNFFGAKKDQQRALDFKLIKAEILQRLGLPPNTTILQLVGDSSRYSAEATLHCKDFLDKTLDPKQHLVLWGFTGKGQKGSGMHDVNQLVNNWLEEDPSRFQSALANVVDFHSVMAITNPNWKCTIAEGNRNYYLVYPDAKFGDDVHSSDYLTDAAICLEGGVQSFRQVVNFISRNICVKGLYNLRGPNNPDTFDPQSNTYLTFFSAAEFLTELAIEIKSKCGSLDKADEAFVTQFKEVYMKSHHLYNPHKQDAATKVPLFEAAWKQFIGEKLWCKLDLCQFAKFQGSKM